MGEKNVQVVFADISTSKKHYPKLRKKNSWLGSPIIQSPNFEAADSQRSRPGINKVGPLSKGQATVLATADEFLELSSLTEVKKERLGSF